jgi:D-cysteine desulfhydrase
MAGSTFNYIFLASGTGTTQAGLICGKILHGSDVDIVGISVARKNPHGANVIHLSVYEYMEQKGINEDFHSHVKFIDDYTLGKYGVGNAEIDELIVRVFRRYGIALNITYTGKAFWGMEQYLREHSIRDSNVLFINTGGLPNFFDDLEARR